MEFPKQMTPPYWPCLPAGDLLDCRLAKSPKLAPCLSSLPAPRLAETPWVSRCGDFMGF